MGDNLQNGGMKMETVKNKYHYDVKNCHYCKGTKKEDGSIAFDEKVKLLPGLMSIDLGAEGDTLSLIHI